MSNECCNNTGDYRKICNYNDWDSCNAVPTSWSCDGKGSCNVVNRPPNDKNLYSSLRECQLNCKGDLTTKSWKCTARSYSGNVVKLCESRNIQPDPSKGFYPNLEDCERDCKKV